ncbi:hypothetical protein ACIPPJ_04960 [Streptomyces sp. NPDC086091]|uniref:hypothetical protein n=1 Tax=Streptomyces sp. NPDC086091 TaxID=3365751 RepID=UPI0038153999
MSEATTLYDDVLYRWEQLPAGTDWPVFAEVVLGQPDLAPYAYYFHEFGTVLAHLPAERDDESLYRQDVVTRFVYWLAGEYGIHEQWPPTEQQYQPEQPYQPGQSVQAEQPYPAEPPYPVDPYAAYGQPDQYGQTAPYGPQDAYPQPDPYAPYDQPAAYTAHAEPAPYGSYDQYAAYDLHAQYAEQPPHEAEFVSEVPPEGVEEAAPADPAPADPVPVDPAALGLLVEAVQAATGDSDGDGTLTEEHVRLIQAHGLSLEVDLDELPPQNAA